MTLPKWQPTRSFWIAAIIAVTVTAVLQVSRVGHQPPRVPFSEFLRDVEQGTVTALVAEGDTLLVTR
ncbi:MAG: ATP-dependent metallopeptidase FtsH/Yme1/Tma family protein, partial [Vicinamibacterales bacterium]